MAVILLLPAIESPEQRDPASTCSSQENEGTPRSIFETARCARLAAKRYLVYPAAHPKFSKQKSCNYLLRVTPSIRSQIPYGSDTFRQLYGKRTAVERVFSRLLTIGM